MKKISFILFLSFAFLTSKAGYELLFCTNADSLGKCKGSGETFIWKGDKTALELVVMNKDTIAAKKLKIKLFAMNNDKDGELYADLGLAVIPNALYAVKKLYFYKPGYYKVLVLDELEGVIAVGYVTVTDREY